MELKNYLKEIEANDKKGKKINAFLQVAPIENKKNGLTLALSLAIFFSFSKNLLAMLILLLTKWSMSRSSLSFSSIMQKP